MRQALSSEKETSVLIATGNPLCTFTADDLITTILRSVQKRIKLNGWSLEAFGVTAYPIFRIMKANH